MRRLLFVLVAVLALRAFARAGDPPADPVVDPYRTKLLEVLLDEEKIDERQKAVAALAGVDKLASAKALLDALDKLATRTAQAEARAAKTRLDYEPYKSAAQAGDKDWAIKQRLLKQMERDDAVLRGDAAVLDAFAAGVAGLKDKESVSFLDRASAKAELVPARRTLVVGLLRNSVSDAKSVAKRAMADSEPAVRLGALLAATERKEAAYVDFAIKTLADPNWTFRQAAIHVLAAQDDPRGVAPLITGMSTEDGRVLEDFSDALQKLTGAKLGPNPDAWKRWYEDHKAELAAKGLPPATPKATKAALGEVEYYGVQTRSKRLLFLIDCSGSMNEVLPGSQTGDQFTGPKIDIAKRMLKKAVSQLEPSTLFDVIIFNTDARAMNDKLVVASNENKAAMYGRIDELKGRGGTYTYGALKLAFGLADAAVTPTAPPVDTIFLLSDGAPTEATFEDAVEAKPMEPEKILASVRQWNPFRAVKIHTIAIDPRLQAGGANFVRFMRDLAGQNAGTYTAIGQR